MAASASVEVRVDTAQMDKAISRAVRLASWHLPMRFVAWYLRRRAQVKVAIGNETPRFLAADLRADYRWHRETHSLICRLPNDVIIVGSAEDLADAVEKMESQG